MNYESTADFKARIALLKRNGEETGKKWSMVGASRPDPSITRQPTDRGYYPPEQKTNKTKGTKLSILT